MTDWRLIYEKIPISVFILRTKSSYTLQIIQQAASF